MMMLRLSCVHPPDRPHYGMRMRHLLLSLLLAAQCAAGSAQAGSTAPAPAERQLRGLSRDEASLLLTKLEEAQRRLKAGEFQVFELLAGSIASYEQTKASPRGVFLEIPFQKVWSIERVNSDNRLWQPFRLAYSPDGMGQRYWDIEVVLGTNGNIERVLMIYKPPAPY